MMDSDFSHDPKNLPGMQKVLETGKATVVVGARYVKGGGTSGWELWRRMLSYFGNLYVRMVTRIPLHDLTAGFIMMKADTLAKIKYDNISASGYAFLIELKYLLWKSGARFFEWPIIFVNRTGGESKISNHIVSEGIVTPWKIKLKN